jgi:hypothetical protein
MAVMQERSEYPTDEVPKNEMAKRLKSDSPVTGESRPPLTEWPVSYSDWERVLAENVKLVKDSQDQEMVPEKLDAPSRTTADERSKKMAAALTAKENKELDLDMAEVCISQLNAEREMLWGRVAHLEAALSFEQKQRWSVSRQLSMLQVAMGADPAEHMAPGHPAVHKDNGATDAHV